jgi:hypothetical protein
MAQGTMRSRMMSKNWSRILVAAACGAGLALAYSAAASAQNQQPPAKQRALPDNFPWEYGPGGKRVPKSRVSKAGDVERKETPKGGQCTTIEERKPGEVKRVDGC